MALRDITLGQHFPGNSFIHRLDPRTKILFTLFFIIALFMAKFVVAYGIVLLILMLGVASSKIPLSVFGKGMKPVVIIVALTAVLNLLYTPGDPLVTVWIFHITEQGLWMAGFMVLRIMMLLVSTLLMTYTTSPLMLTDGLDQLMSPLKKVKVPVHELSMMMSIALRFIPTLIQETDKIISAQKARGADFESGNLLQRAKALVPVLIPLFISAFRRAEDLAVAMECRCYHGGEGRTRLRQLAFHRADYVMITFGPLLCVGIGVLRYFGL